MAPGMSPFKPAVNSADSARCVTGRVEFCPNGHQRTPGTTRLEHRRNAPNLTRVCRICESALNHRQYLRRKDESGAADRSLNRRVRGLGLHGKYL